MTHPLPVPLLNRWQIPAALRRVRDRLTANRRALAAIGQIPAVAGASLPDLAARWAELDLDRKQGLLRLFVSEIRIGPAVRGLGFFDPARVERVPASPNRARPPR